MSKDADIREEPSGEYERAYTDPLCPVNFIVGEERILPP